MALINCKECAREISDKAVACPGCGAPSMNASPIGHPMELEPKLSAFPEPKPGERPYVVISAHVETSQGKEVVASFLARHICTLEPRFDVATMKFVKSGTAIGISLTPTRNGWLIHAEHNLVSEKSSAIGTWIFSLIFIYLGLTVSFWFIPILLGILLLGKSLTTSILAPQLAQCLLSTKKHFENQASLR